MQAFRQHIEQELESVCAGCPDTELVRAAKYVVLGGGHRWRGSLALAAGMIFDEGTPSRVLPLAAALELMHAASLVLDDLPSMDNARIRRGRDCVHRVFPPSITDMLPAFLVNLAFRSYAIIRSVTPEAFRDGLEQLGAAGTDLARGQELDLSLPAEAVSEESLMDCYARKSGALFAAALAGGARICGAGPEEATSLHDAGLKLGQAYQILDDLRETPGEDSHCTAVTLWGAEAARSRAEDLLADVSQTVGSFGAPAERLQGVLDEIRAAAS